MTQNTAQHMAQILFGHEKLEYALGPRPNATVRPIRGLTSRRAISASLEGFLSRGPSTRKQSPPRSRLPQPSPPRTLGTGETPPRSSPPRQTEVAAQPPDGTGRTNSPTTPRHGVGVRWCQTVSDGVSWRRPPCHIADVTGVSSTCARHCAAIPGVG